MNSSFHTYTFSLRFQGKLPTEVHCAKGTSRVSQLTCREGRRGPPSSLGQSLGPPLGEHFYWKMKTEGEPAWEGSVGLPRRSCPSLPDALSSRTPAVHNHALSSSPELGVLLGRDPEVYPTDKFISAQAQIANTKDRNH